MNLLDESEVLEATQDRGGGGCRLPLRPTCRNSKSSSICLREIVYLFEKVVAPAAKKAEEEAAEEAAEENPDCIWDFIDSMARRNLERQSGSSANASAGIKNLRIRNPGVGKLVLHHLEKFRSEYSHCCDHCHLTSEPRVCVTLLRALVYRERTSSAAPFFQPIIQFFSLKDFEGTRDWLFGLEGGKTKELVLKDIGVAIKKNATGAGLNNVIVSNLETLLSEARRDLGIVAYDGCYFKRNTLDIDSARSASESENGADDDVEVARKTSEDEDEDDDSLSIGFKSTPENTNKSAPRPHFELDDSSYQDDNAFTFDLESIPSGHNLDSQNDDQSMNDKSEQDQESDKRSIGGLSDDAQGSDGTVIRSNSIIGGGANLSISSPLSSNDGYDDGREILLHSMKMLQQQFCQKP